MNKHKTNVSVTAIDITEMEREEERKNGVWGDRNKRKDVYRHINQSQYMYNY